MEDSQLILLINKCIKDDRKAQNELYRQLYSYGLGICMRYVHEESEARTVLNEGFYKVFRNLKKYNPQYDFKPWFKTIMVNASLDYLRKNEKVRQQSSLDFTDVPINSSAISNLSFEELLKVINYLPIAYKTVFNLYVVDGYRHEEIAQKLNISVSTSKSNLSRAKAKLRDLITANILV